MTKVGCFRHTFITELVFVSYLSAKFIFYSSTMHLDKGVDTGWIINSKLLGSNNASAVLDYSTAMKRNERTIKIVKVKCPRGQESLRGTLKLGTRYPCSRAVSANSMYRRC